MTVTIIQQDLEAMERIKARTRENRKYKNPWFPQKRSPLLASHQQKELMLKLQIEYSSSITFKKAASLIAKKTRETGHDEALANRLIPSLKD